jgi:mono/diheme cytochrome c family protein
MKRAFKLLGGLVAVVIVLLVGLVLVVEMTWDRPVNRVAPAMTAPRDSATVARGSYIFNVTWQCANCHEAGEEHVPPAASGGKLFDLRSAGPGFGKYYSKNITPDTATGIGGWTDGEIVQAIREGVNRQRHVLFPLMPVDWLKEMSDNDVLALVAYLRTLPPIHNRVPGNEPSFVAKALMTFNIIGPTTPSGQHPQAPAVSAEYGRYFALHVAGCADCHTPRNMTNGKFYLDSLFAGSSFAFGKDADAPLWAFARNITPHDNTGIGRWTEEEFAHAVTGGVTPDSTVLTPYMPYPRYKFLAPDDLKAMYLFVRSLTPLHRVTPPVGMSPALTSSRGAERGTLIFRTRCSACHGAEGKGATPTRVKLAEVAPSLSDADLMEFIARGQVSLKMPAFGKTLTQEELADVAAYIRKVSGPHQR